MKVNLFGQGRSTPKTLFLIKNQTGNCSFIILNVKPCTNSTEIKRNLKATNLWHRNSDYIEQRKNLNQKILQNQILNNALAFHSINSFFKQAFMVILLVKFFHNSFLMRVVTPSVNKSYLKYPKSHQHVI